MPVTRSDSCQSGVHGPVVVACGRSDRVVVVNFKELTAASGPLVLADLSGYTSFLRDVAEAHPDAFAGGAVPNAYGLISSLLDGIIRHLAPPFTLSKIEGDAVFVFAEDADVVPRGSDLLECLHACYADFQQTLGEARAATLCTCGVCSRDTLDLKFVLHAGPFVLQPIGGGRELSGPEVVMAHRLLKSDAAALTGNRAYALTSDAAVARFRIPTDLAVPLVESFEHYPPITVHVFPL